MLNNQKLCLRVNFCRGTLERDRGALKQAAQRSAVAWVSSPRIRVMGLGRGSTITVELNGSNPVTLSEIRWREGGGGGVLQGEGCRSAEQSGVAGWRRCVFTVRDKSRDRFETSLFIISVEGSV